MMTVIMVPCIRSLFKIYFYLFIRAVVRLFLRAGEELVTRPMIISLIQSEVLLKRKIKHGTCLITKSSVAISVRILNFTDLEKCSWYNVKWEAGQRTYRIQQKFGYKNIIYKHTHPTSGNKMLVVVNVRELAVQVKRVLMDRYSFYLAECFLNFLNFLQWIYITL